MHFIRRGIVIIQPQQMHAHAVAAGHEQRVGRGGDAGHHAAGFGQHGAGLVEAGIRHVLADHFEVRRILVSQQEGDGKTRRHFHHAIVLRGQAHPRRRRLVELRDRHGIDGEVRRHAVGNDGQRVV